MYFLYSSSKGQQNASNENDATTVSNPNFSVLAPYLGAKVSLSSRSTYTSYDRYFLAPNYYGNLVRGSEDDSFRLNYSNIGVPPVEVTYVP